MIAKLNSWIEIPSNSDFSMYNIPFGIFSTATIKHHAATAIGNTLVDLYALSKHNYFKGIVDDSNLFKQAHLNDFIALGKPTTNKIRNRLIELFSLDNKELRSNTAACKEAFRELTSVEMRMPIKVGDYTDFYSSIDHATNMGSMFRDPKNALLPNWKHIPVGYHGRSSSIIVSGTNFHRPKGQVKPADAEVPLFSASNQMDIELEMAFVIGKPTSLGDTITTAAADEYIFGMLLFNDWSARDIQSWEYVPLGPFLGKNFASTLSPWIVTLEALEPFRVDGYKQDPPVLPYLQYSGKKNIDINLEVYLEAPNLAPQKICTSNYKYLYWTMEQQLAHHTVNGCNVNVGDLMASGTISGPEEGSYGSLMELTWKGTKPIKLADGSERKFLQDNDTIIIRGFASKDGIRVGFGECKGKLLPATK
ncbi:MAG: fumarylacetoacetase [Bacteroidetes bacterium]|nr:fumarylacetoacetase [Bacteroidota bacterium]